MLRVRAADCDIAKQRHPSAGSNRSSSRGRDYVHTSLVLWGSPHIGVPEKPFNSNAVACFLKNLFPRVNGGRMSAMHPAGLHASASVVAQLIQLCPTAASLTHFIVWQNWKTKSPSQETLENRIT